MIQSSRIPATVEKVGDYAFANTRLDVLHFEDTSILVSIGFGVSWLKHSSFFTHHVYSCNFYLIVYIIFNHLQAFEYCWKILSVKIPATVETIGGDAFAFASGIKNLVFTDDSSLTTIGRNVRDLRPIASIYTPHILTFIYVCITSNIQCFIGIWVLWKIIISNSTNRC